MLAKAEAYPTRPVRIVAGYAPGGGVDITARLIGQWLSERLGQSFIIENRPGAGSNIATEYVIRSPADGYTLQLIDTTGAINATLYDNLNFNFIRDMAPVAGILSVPNILMVHPSVACSDRSGVHRLRQGQPRKGQCGFRRHRNIAASFVRAFQDDDRRRHGACPLSGHGAGLERSARRTSAGVFCHGVRIHPVRHGRQAQGAGGNNRITL